MLNSKLKSSIFYFRIYLLSSIDINARYQSFDFKMTFLPIFSFWNQWLSGVDIDTAQPLAFKITGFYFEKRNPVWHQYQCCLALMLMLDSILN